MKKLFQDSALNVAKWSLTDFYEDEEKELMEAIYSGEDFTTGWYSCSKEIRSGEITRMNDDRMENFREEVNDMEDAAADYFQDAEQSEKEFLRVFSMINMLAYDVYVRRMLIEKLVDRYFRDEDPGQVKNQRRKKKTGSAPDSER